MNLPHVVIYSHRSKMGFIMQGLNLPGRRSLLAAWGSLHPCVYAARLYRPTVEVETSRHRMRMQPGVRGYANSFLDNLEENKPSGFREALVNSGEWINFG